MICNGQLLLKMQPIVGMLGAKVQHNGVSHGLSEAGYDIRLKQTVEFYSRWNEPRVAVDGKEAPGRFALASAMEIFDMPPDLVGIVHDKSTWARHGLSVFNTVIEPGFKGGLTLELVYHGGSYLKLPEGTGIAQVLFHRTQMPAQYTGKYQNQSSEPVAPIMTE